MQVTRYDDELRTDPNRLLRPRQAATLLGVTTRALDAWRYQGRGPQFVRVSQRCVRYRRRDLLDWMRSRLDGPTRKFRS
jgi:predicted DNA-binding transcriptional regulator AlpA